MDEYISELIEVLESLIEDDTPQKIRNEIDYAIKLLNDASEVEDLIKAQEQLEVITSMSSLDSFTRNEIYNVLNAIEELK